MFEGEGKFYIVVVRLFLFLGFGVWGLEVRREEVFLLVIVFLNVGIRFMFKFGFVGFFNGCLYLFIWFFFCYCNVFVI